MEAKVINKETNIVMGANIAELKRAKKNEEELLQSLKNRGADEAVIKAQQDVVDAKTSSMMILWKLKGRHKRIWATHL